jgi:hypothetical protein
MKTKRESNAAMKYQLLIYFPPQAEDAKFSVYQILNSGKQAPENVLNTYTYTSPRHLINAFFLIHISYRCSADEEMLGNELLFTNVGKVCKEFISLDILYFEIVTNILQLRQFSSN